MRTFFIVLEKMITKKEAQNNDVGSKSTLWIILKIKNYHRLGNLPWLSVLYFRHYDTWFHYFQT